MVAMCQCRLLSTAQDQLLGIHPTAHLQISMPAFVETLQGGIESGLFLLRPATLPMACRTHVHLETVCTKCLDKEARAIVVQRGQCDVLAA